MCKRRFCNFAAKLPVLGVTKPGLLFTLLIGGILVSNVSLAQDSVIAPLPITKNHTFHFLGRSAKRDAREGKLLITPFLFPGYAPDIEYSVAGGAIFSFKTRLGDTLLPISSVPVTLTYSSINSFIASSGWTTFWLHDKLRVNALIQYKASRDAATIFP
jgi:hypothetical protein